MVQCRFPEHTHQFQWWVSMLLFQNNFALWGVFCRFDICLPPLETIIFSVPCFLSGIRNWEFICSYIVSPRPRMPELLEGTCCRNHSFPSRHGGTRRIQSSWMARGSPVTSLKPRQENGARKAPGAAMIHRQLNQIVYICLLAKSVGPRTPRTHGNMCCCSLWNSLLLLLLMVMMMTLTISLESPPKDPFLVVSRFYALNLYQCPITENPIKSREIPISCWWFNTIFFHGSVNIGFIMVNIIINITHSCNSYIYIYSLM